jgi:hypothetical protein
MYGKKQTFSESAREFVSNYFSFISSEQAYVVKGKDAVIFPSSASPFSNFLKIASCFTMIIPILMLIAQVMLRLGQPCKLDLKLTSELKHLIPQGLVEMGHAHIKCYAFNEKAAAIPLCITVPFSVTAR